jgi:type II secretory pathway pseudopilin PulG
MGEKGFTLIEALVVFSLLGLGLLFFVQNSLLAIRLHDRGRRMSEALLLAQEKLELLEAGGWEKAVQDCSPDGAARYRSETVVRGARYLLLLEKAAASRSLEYFTVTCFWEGPDGLFSRESSLSLCSARSVLL